MCVCLYSFELVILLKGLLKFHFFWPETCIVLLAIGTGCYEALYTFMDV